jgi:hypothetical protein
MVHDVGVFLGCEFLCDSRSPPAGSLMCAGFAAVMRLSGGRFKPFLHRKKSLSILKTSIEFGGPCHARAHGIARDRLDADGAVSPPTTRIFRALDNSPERDSVLNALGRVGEPVLKHKIRHRSKGILAKVGDHLPDLQFVTDHAVECRNHYAHGSPRLDYYYNNFFDVVTFFTNSLEFVFAASDLIDAGWDIVAWYSTPTSGYVS